VLPGIGTGNPCIDYLHFPPGGDAFSKHSLELLRPGVSEGKAGAKGLRIAECENARRSRSRLLRDLAVAKTQGVDPHRLIVSKRGLSGPQHMSHLRVEVVELLRIEKTDGGRVDRPQGEFEDGEGHK